MQVRGMQARGGPPGSYGPDHRLMPGTRSAAQPEGVRGERFILQLSAAANTCGPTGTQGAAERAAGANMHTGTSTKHTRPNCSKTLAFRLPILTAPSQPPRTPKTAGTALTN